MLDYKIIEYKSTLKDKNGKDYVDLMSKSFSADAIIDGHPLIVNKWYVARPDLISLAVYGDDKYGDIICKVNGISNPFELNEDDILFIPDIESIMECCKQSDNASELVSKTNAASQEIRTNKLEKYQKTKSEKRSSNEQIVGDKNFVIDKSLGVIFY